ncbi:hypothetical protein OSB04_007120 [Centaurea solstitialis]|uniref:Uncharacterized protein n=1 Tax=Centaurea solstitialis TaxID=347529 RepID=A0AA38TJ99_9ASTR|nr:hypothetical protein OSB04_007120 [Centaurea solstitialis]
MKVTVAATAMVAATVRGEDDDDGGAMTTMRKSTTALLLFLKTRRPNRALRDEFKLDDYNFNGAVKVLLKSVQNTEESYPFILVPNRLVDTFPRGPIPALEKVDIAEPLSSLPEALWFCTCKALRPLSNLCEMKLLQELRCHFYILDYMERLELTDTPVHGSTFGPVTVSMVERISRVPEWIPDTSSTSIGECTYNATTMAESTCPEFNILDSERLEYHRWVSDVETTFIGKEYSYIIKSPSDPQDKPSEKVQASALIFLRRHIDPSLRWEYLQLKTPQELWDALKERFVNVHDSLLPELMGRGRGRGQSRGNGRDGFSNSWHRDVTAGPSNQEKSKGKAPMIDPTKRVRDETEPCYRCGIVGH